MGEVYRARDRQTGSTVAVKLMRTRELEPERFDREARVLEELAHPHIVRCLGHGKASSGEKYFAMEWLEGEDLEARLRREGLRLDASLAIARGVASALAHAHE